MHYLHKVHFQSFFNVNYSWSRNVLLSFPPEFSSETNGIAYLPLPTHTLEFASDKNELKLGLNALTFLHKITFHLFEI